MQASIFPLIIKGAWFYISSVKKIFTKDFIKQHWYQHMLYSFILGIIFIGFALLKMGLDDTPLLFQMFIGGLGLFTVNFLREWWMGVKHEAPMDLVDCIMGSYGGILSVLFLNLFI